MPRRQGRAAAAAGSAAADGEPDAGAPLPPAAATQRAALEVAPPPIPGRLARAWGRFMGTPAGSEGGRWAARAQVAAAGLARGVPRECQWLETGPEAPGSHSIEPTPALP
jgi:hypothetical protein